jgi:para-nitrobenzyl esterase
MGRAAAREGMVERGARNWAIEQGKYGAAPVYIFMYSRVHPYIPGVTIADQDTATIGAYHTSDVPYWFGTQDALNLIRPTRNWTPSDRELSKQMTEALIAFAKTGDPNTAAVHWPKWTPQSEQLVEFGDAIKVQPMNTQRLNFMAAHGAAQATPRAARD